MARVQPQRDPAAYARMLRERARQEWERQRNAAVEAQKQARITAMQKAADGDPSAPVWAQIRQCYIEYRPAQIMYQRQMMRCSGGEVYPVYIGRRTCLHVQAEEKVVNVA